ncbi:MAG: GAF domain-containing protein [Tissierellia bacterium]|nr:GAF domain-containing protein [Tissierellia bacterium]
MFTIKDTTGMTDAKVYEYIWELIEQQLHEEGDYIANLSNISAILKACLQDVNWVGFYLWNGQNLVLGPFQGLPACNRIPMGVGVCGHAARQERSVLVEDVEAFPGHIPCDGATKSELVLPIVYQGQLIGVLDVDSPVLARFTSVDQRELEGIITKILPALVGEEYYD